MNFFHNIKSTILYTAIVHNFKKFNEERGHSVVDGLEVGGRLKGLQQGCVINRRRADLSL